jgi:hypothetical protein
MSIKLEEGKVVVDPEFGIGVILMTSKKETVIRFGEPNEPDIIFATGADDGKFPGTDRLIEHEFHVGQLVFDKNEGTGVVVGLGTPDDEPESFMMSVQFHGREGKDLYLHDGSSLYSYEKTLKPLEEEMKTENRKFLVGDKVVDPVLGVGTVCDNSKRIAVSFDRGVGLTIVAYGYDGKYLSTDPKCERKITHAEEPETSPVLFKKGDRVFTPSFGWGTVQQPEKYGCYPVAVVFSGVLGQKEYTADGKVEKHLPRTLFFAEPEITEAMLNRPTHPHLEEDTPIMVKCAGQCNWVKRHFKRWSDRGRAITYFDGQSKWTADSRETEWAEWKLP